jgi:DNA repair exonuclease SbcCD nuclease subunit
MRFLHTSDWQLGKPFGRAPAEARNAFQEARLDVIDTIAAAARKNNAPTVLVAGDVFDNSEPGDRVFRQALARMKAAHDVTWILLPGNHDPARADGLWSRLSAEAPANVRPCLEAAAVELSPDCFVLPAPLQFKRSLDDPTAWFDTADIPAGAQRIGLAHGSIQDFGSSDPATNLIAPDRARRSGLDYLALGDWHGRKEIDPRTHYSGTPEADDFGRDTTGVALLVDLPAAGAIPQVSEISTGRYAWTDAAWQLSDAAGLEDLVSALAPGIARKNLVARLTLSGLVTLSERVAIHDHLAQYLAHDIRWLDLRMTDLYCRPTDHDLAEIDAHGVLRDAAERLLALSAEPGSRGRQAAAALERLYVEHQRAQRLAVS